MAKLETQINQIFLSPAESNKVSLILFEEKISTGNHLFLIAELRNIQKKTELNDLSKIAELVISSFKLKRKVSGEALFENALADINNELADFAHKGRKSWLGKFSALIALKSDRDFYTANTGLTAAWLRRKNTLNEVLAPEKSATQPLKTFANFSTGRIMDSDNLILCTSSLFNYVSVELFSKTLSGYDLEEACTRITDILQSSARSDEGFAVFMLGMSKQVPTQKVNESNDSYTVTPQPEFDDDQLIEPSEQITKSQVNQESVSLVDEAPALSSAKKKRGKSLEAITAPKSHVGNKKAESSALPDASPPVFTPPAGNIYAPHPEDIKQEQKGHRKFIIPSFKSLPSWTALPALPSWSSVKQLPASIPNLTIPWISKISSRLPNLQIPIWSHMSGPAKFFFGSFLLFAILFGMNIAAYQVRQTQTEQNERFNQSAQLLVDYLSDAESALIYKNHSQAMKFMSDAATELHKLEQLDKEDSEAFQVKFDEMNNKINRVTTLRNLTPFSEIDYPITFMARAGNNYIVANNNSNSFAALNNFELSPIFLLNRVDGDLRGISHASGAGNYAISKDKVYLINSTAQEYQMDEYISNADLYSLQFSDPNRLHAINKTTNQVIRLTLNGTSVSAPQNILKSSVSLQAARDLAVDDDVYVLLPDSVLKFSNGQPVNFNLSPISEPPSNLTKMRLGNQLYLLEPVAKRILIYNRTGELLNQVQLPDLTELSDMYVDESLREIILVNGTRLYRITF